MLGTKNGPHSLGHKKNGREIDVDNLPPMLRGNLGVGKHGSVTSGVDQNIDATAVVFGLLNQVDALLRIGDVGGNAQNIRTSAKVRGGALKRIGIAPGKYDEIIALEKFLGSSRTNPAGAAGDDGCFVFHTCRPAF